MATRSTRKEAKGDEPESILSMLVSEQAQSSADEEFANDVSVLFCGMRRSGKTSLIDRFINPNKDDKDPPKPTVALDYKFIRYASETSTSKVIAHLYDLGGDETLVDLTRIAVSPTTVGNLMIGIVLDLSEPHRVIPSLTAWLSVLRELVGKSMQGLVQGSPSGEKRTQTMEAARMEVWDQHPDKSLVNPFPVPLVIFANKYDVMLQQEDPEKRKRLCHALRYFAHVNGASLLLSTLKDKASVKTTRALLRQFLFGITEKGGVPEQLDPSKPVSVMAGRDSLKEIGTPQGARDGNVEQAWRDQCALLFPLVASQAAQKEGGGSEVEQMASELQKFPERAIDGMVEQRLGELQQYRRQVERNQRLASEGLDGQPRHGAILTH